MPDSVHDGSGGDGGSQTTYLYLSSEVVFAVNRNLTTLTLYAVAKVLFNCDPPDRH
jgi:hypothetical protein